MKYFAFFLSTVLFSVFCKAQVAITDIDTVSTVDSSAILDLSSENRGFLPPRMSTATMDSIDSPAEGLVVYNTTLSTLLYFDGTDWAMIVNKDGESCGLITYEGKIYETVIIGKQCWMAENLNVGNRINGIYNQNNPSAIEKYCYNDDENNCNNYGGLYQWDQAMDYTTQEGAKGICPPGWHIPTDEEWKILEGSADTQYPVGDPEWDDTGWRGYDAGKRLKSTAGWSTNSGTDAFNFTALPGGERRFNGSTFVSLGIEGYWWSSTETSSSNAWRRVLRYDGDGAYRSDLYPKDRGFSVRCLKN